MDTTHKHRKGFRADAEVLAEAYSNIYKEEKEQLEEGLLSTGAGAMLGGVVGGPAGAIAGGVLGSEMGKDNDKAEDQEIGKEDVAIKFQPGQFVDVLGDDGEFSHQEVVLNVTGDVVTTIRTEGDGKPYGDTSRGYHDINLISPQDLESGKYSAEPTGYHEW